MSVKNSKEIIYSQKKLIVNKFKKHKFAVYSFYFLTLLYTITTFAEFFHLIPLFKEIVNFFMHRLHRYIFLINLENFQSCHLYMN